MSWLKLPAYKLRPASNFASHLQIVSGRIVSCTFEKGHQEQAIMLPEGSLPLGHQQACITDWQKRLHIGLQQCGNKAPPV